MKKAKVPVLHELAKLVLTFMPDKVSEILRNRYPTWKTFREWEVVGTFPEFPLSESWMKADRRKIFADTAWLMRRKNKKGKTVFRYIVHEIKTGKFDFEQEVKLYQASAIKRSCVCGSTHLYFWIPEKFMEFCSTNDKEINLLIRLGFVRIVKLDYLMPLIKELVEEAERQIEAF